MEKESTVRLLHSSWHVFRFFLFLGSVHFYRGSATNSQFLATIPRVEKTFWTSLERKPEAGRFIPLSGFQVQSPSRAGGKAVGAWADKCSKSKSPGPKGPENVRSWTCLDGLGLECMAKIGSNSGVMGDSLGAIWELLTQLALDPPQVEAEISRKWLGDKPIDTQWLTLGHARSPTRVCQRGTIDVWLTESASQLLAFH